MRLIVGMGILAVVGFLCSGCGVSENAVATGIAQTGEAQALQAIVQTATAIAMATDTPTVTLTPTPAPPTRTPAPPWCNQYPGGYLNEVQRIFDGRESAIIYWNNSARGDAALLQTEVMIRDLIAEAEALIPPTDFQEMHGHFLSFLQASLATTFGIIDQSEDHRQGGNLTVDEEWDLTSQAWERALALREQQCP